jgi:hypothetical protein
MFDDLQHVLEIAKRHNIKISANIFVHQNDNPKENREQFIKEVGKQLSEVVEHTAETYVQWSRVAKGDLNVNVLFYEDELEGREQQPQHKISVKER